MLAELTVRQHSVRVRATRLDLAVPVMADAYLLSLAQQRLREGALPTIRKFRTFGGPGEGQPCRLCQAPILGNEPEIEVEWTDGEQRRTMLLHFRCQSAWLQAITMNAASGAAAGSVASVAPAVGASSARVIRNDGA